MEHLLENDGYENKSCYFCSNATESGGKLYCKIYPNRKIQVYFNNKEKNYESDMKQEYIKSNLYATNCKEYKEHEIFDW